MEQEKISTSPEQIGPDNGAQVIARFNFSRKRQGVRIITNDTVNNVNNTFVINFTVDKSAPTVTFTVPSAGSTISGVNNFRATITDNLTQVQTSYLPVH